MKFWSYILPAILTLSSTIAFAQTDRQRARQSYKAPSISRPAPQPTRTTSPQNVRPAPQSNSNCGGMDQQSCEAYHLVNRVRNRLHLHSLDVNEKCIRAAEAHAQDMARNGYFDHNSPRETWQQRMVRFNLNRAAVAENIAKTGSGPDRAVDLWVDSPGHYKNMIGRHFESTGMGYSNGYYVQCFSGERGMVLREL